MTNEQTQDEYKGPKDFNEMVIWIDGMQDAQGPNEIKEVLSKWLQHMMQQESQHWAEVITKNISEVNRAFVIDLVKEIDKLKDNGGLENVDLSTVNFNHGINRVTAYLTNKYLPPSEVVESPPS